MSSSRSIVVLGVAALLLSACGEVRESLGLGRNAPDEFAVVEHPPLTMPPDYGLRPPRPGAATSIDTTARARAALYSGTAVPSQASTGEKALLSAAGAAQVSPDIRETIDREAAQKVTASPHLIERLMGGEGPRSGTTVDAEAEAKRIKDAREKGEALNNGATPVIEKQKSSWLGL